MIVRMSAEERDEGTSLCIVYTDGSSGSVDDCVRIDTWRKGGVRPLCPVSSECPQHNCILPIAACNLRWIIHKL